MQASLVMKMAKSPKSSELVTATGLQLRDPPVQPAHVRCTGRAVLRVISHPRSPWGVRIGSPVLKKEV